MQEEVISQSAKINNMKDVAAIFIFSWGFDGSTGFSQYKQRYSNSSVETESEVYDTNLFAITCISLRLVTSNGIILWNNPTSQSSRFCRPIALKWMKETSKSILQQKKLIQDQIDELEVLEMQMEDYTIRIHFSLHMTLIDGKVLNVITNTKSSQSCPICHAKPSQFNDLTNKTRGTFLPNPDSLQYGISSLHAWIRLLECCLNISYKINIKKWQARTEDEKKDVAKRKSEIQMLVWEKLGLRVDKPKPGEVGQVMTETQHDVLLRTQNCLQIF